MKNFLFCFLAVLALGLLCRWGLPWWAIVPIGAVAGWAVRPGAGAGFGAGFMAGFLLWFGLALALHIANGGLLATRVGQLMQGLSGGVMLLVTGLLGGLLAGFGVLTGHLGRELVFPPRKSYMSRRRRKR